MEFRGGAMADGGIWAASDDMRAEPSEPRLPFGVGGPRQVDATIELLVAAVPDAVVYERTRDSGLQVYYSVNYMK